MSFSEWYGASAATVSTHSNYTNSYSFTAEYKGASSYTQFVCQGSVNQGWTSHYGSQIPYSAFKNVSGNPTKETQRLKILDNGVVEIIWGWTYTTNSTDFVHQNRNVGANPNFQNFKLELGGSNSSNNLTTQNYTSFSLVNVPASGSFLGETKVVFAARSAVNSLVSSSSTSIRNFRATVTYS